MGGFERGGGAPVGAAGNQFLAAFAGPAAVTPTGDAGLAVHQVGCMSAAAHPGQVVVSEATAAALGPHPSVAADLVDLGEVRLSRLVGAPAHLRAPPARERARVPATPVPRRPSTSRAAGLLAVAGAARARIGAPVPPLYRPEIEAARALLPPGASRPSSLSLDDAVAAELAGR